MLLLQSCSDDCVQEKVSHLNFDCSYCGPIGPVQDPPPGTIAALNPVQGARRSRVHERSRVLRYPKCTPNTPSTRIFGKVGGASKRIDSYTFELVVSQAELQAVASVRRWYTELGSAMDQRSHLASQAKLQGAFDLTWPSEHGAYIGECIPNEAPNATLGHLKS